MTFTYHYSGYIVYVYNSKNMYLNMHNKFNIILIKQIKISLWYNIYDMHV